MKTLTYQGDCTDFDPNQVLGTGTNRYTINHAVYDEKTNKTTVFLQTYSGTFVGSRGSIGTTEKGKM